MSALDNIINHLGYAIVESSEKGYGEPEQRAKSEIKALMKEIVESSRNEYDIRKAIDEL